MHKLPERVHALEQRVAKHGKEIKALHAGSGDGIEKLLGKTVHVQLKNVGYDGVLAEIYRYSILLILDAHTEIIINKAALLTVQKKEKVS